MKKLENFSRGMGIGGWLTNYKRFNVLPPERRMQITIGDLEHFESYITERDVEYIASLGMDHIRIGFDALNLFEIFEGRGEIFDALRRESGQIVKRFADLIEKLIRDGDDLLCVCGVLGADVLNHFCVRFDHGLFAKTHPIFFDRNSAKRGEGHTVIFVFVCELAPAIYSDLI